MMCTTILKKFRERPGSAPDRSAQFMHEIPANPLPMKCYKKFPQIPEKSKSGPDPAK
jgi:hypothetical protein